MDGLDDSVKKALIWEVQEGAIDLFLRRWKFRLSLAATVGVATITILAFKIDPWIQGVAKSMLEEKITVLAEAETATIQMIRHEQAKMLLDYLADIQKLRLQAEEEGNRVTSARESLKEVIDSLTYLKENAEALPVLARALESSIDRGQLDYEARLQKAEAVVDQLTSAFATPATFRVSSGKDKKGPVGPENIGKHSFCALSKTQAAHKDVACGCLVEENEGFWYLTALKGAVTDKTCHCQAICLSSVTEVGAG